MPKEIVAANLEELINRLENLPIEQRLAVAEKLIGEESGLTVILGGNNVVNNSFAIQLNGDSEDISKQINNLPPETFANLVDAIAHRIKNPPKSEG